MSFCRPNARFRPREQSARESLLGSARLQNAMGMLRSGSDNASEVATRTCCGFSNITYLCRVFEKQLGVTPGTFRKSR